MVIGKTAGIEILKVNQLSTSTIEEVKDRQVSMAVLHHIEGENQADFLVINLRTESAKKRTPDTAITRTITGTSICLPFRCRVTP